MIFWFRAKDGIVSLAGLVIWVMCAAALSILLFNEGISFAETGKTVLEETFPKAPQNIYIKAGKKVADLRYDKEITFDDNDYRVFFNDDNKGLYISSGLRIYNSDNNPARLSIRKRSAGRSRLEAQRKAEELGFNYNIKGDTIFLDEYFSIPAGSKWSVDDVRAAIYIPEGTKVHFDKTTEFMFRDIHYENDEWYGSDNPENSVKNETGNDEHYWIMTNEGLRRNP
jgi:hypothetical protein